MKATAKPVIEISTSDWDRKPFKIDGKVYHFRDRREYTTPQLKKLQALGERLSTFEGDLDDWEETLRDGVNDLVAEPIPAKVMDDLPPGLKLDIIMAFFAEAGWKAKPAKKTASKKRRSAAGARGKSSRSRGRSTSTAARSRTG